MRIFNNGSTKSVRKRCTLPYYETNTTEGELEDLVSFEDVDHVLSSIDESGSYVSETFETGNGYNTTITVSVSRQKNGKFRMIETRTRKEDLTSFTYNCH